MAASASPWRSLGGHRGICECMNDCICTHARVCVCACVCVCTPAQQQCPMVRLYYMICRLQHVARNAFYKFDWKLVVVAWGLQCETKRSKQQNTMRSVHVIRFANGEERASVRQRARDRKIQMPHDRQQAQENPPRVIHLPVQ